VQANVVLVIVLPFPLENLFISIKLEMADIKERDSDVTDP
jgi:hypothetical protein